MSKSETQINLRRQPADTPITFKLEPDAAARDALAKELKILGVKKLRFEGEIKPAGKRDWVLKAMIGATVSQPCVITLEPVSTRIDEKVVRLYLANYSEPEEEGSETEMPDDEAVEPIPDILNLETVMAEALALALPLYPRAENAQIEQGNFAGPGVAPMTDEDIKPFAGLAGLRDKLIKDDPDD